MATIAQLVVDLQATTAQFRQQMAAASRHTDDMRRSADTLRQSVDRMSSGMRLVGGVVAAMGLTAVSRGFLDTALAVQQVESKLKFATGSAEGAANAMAFVNAESDRLGLSVRDAANSFGSLSAATRGTSMQGSATKEMFLGISEAAVALGLSIDDTKGAFKALEQIVSKGKLSAEELRGQLGERIPGAFQIAARAAGVTAQQLDKMLERGEVMSDQFLPRFAAELRKTFGASAADSAKGLGGSINRLNSELFRLAQTQAARSTVDGLTAAISMLTRNMDALLFVAGSALVFALARASAAAITYTAATTRQALASIETAQAAQLAAQAEARRALVVKEGALADLAKARAAEAVALAEIPVLQATQQRIALQAALARGTSAEAAMNALLAESNAAVAAAERAATAATAQRTAAANAAAVASANLARATATVTLAANAAAVSMRVLNSVMAFFGGPVGLAIMAAAGAMYYFSTRTDTASQSTEQLNNKTQELLGNFKALQIQQLDMHMSSIRQKVDELKASMEQLNKTATIEPMALSGDPFGFDSFGARGNTAEQISKEQAAVKVQVDAYVADLDRLQKKKEEVSREADKAPVAASAAGGSEKFTTYLNNLKEEAALVGKNSQLDKVRWEIQSGALGAVTAQQRAQLEGLAIEIDRKEKLQEIEKQRISYLSNLQEESDLIGKNTQLDKVRFDLQSGALSKISTQQRAQILNLAMEIDRKQQLQRIEAERNDLINDQLGKLDDVLAMVQTQADAELQAHERRLTVLQNSLDLKLISEQTYWATREKLASDHEFRMIQISQEAATERAYVIESMQGDLYHQFTGFLNSMTMAEQATGAQRLGIITNTLAQVTQAGAAHNKKMFELNKAAAIANAIVSTAMGAAKALEWGWPLGPIFAGLMVAAGAAQISAIRSAKFGGGGSVGAGGAAAGGGGSVNVPNNPQVQAAPAPAQPMRDVTIVMPEKGLIPVGSVRELIEEINAQIGNNIKVRSA